jgi:hypothetical protein
MEDLLLRYYYGMTAIQSVLYECGFQLLLWNCCYGVMLLTCCYGIVAIEV